MELAELQSVWQRIGDEVAAKEFVDNNTVSTTMRQRSKAELNNIRAAMYRKFIIGSITGVIVLGATFLSIWIPDHFQPLDMIFTPWETTLFYATLSISLTAMLWFNYRAYRQLHTLQTSGGNIKESLSKFIMAMELAMNFNIYSDTFMSPVFFTWFYYAYAYRGHSFSWDSKAFLLFLIPLIIGVASYFFQRYQQQLKFGKYVDRLRSYLTSLEAAED